MLRNDQTADAEIAGSATPSHNNKVDKVLHSSPDTVLWGYLAANVPPAVTVKAGEVVDLECLSHQGLTTERDPVKFFSAYGIGRDQVLADAVAVYAGAK